MNLSLVIHSLACGGAERVFSRLASHWAGAGHTVTVFTLAGPEIPPFFPLHERVRVVPLALATPSRSLLSRAANAWKRIRRLRKEFFSAQTDVAVSFMNTTNILAVRAAKGRIPVLVSERSDPARLAMGRLGDLARNRAYARAARVVTPTQWIGDWFPEPVRRKVTVIPNPVSPCPPPEPAPPGAPPPYIAAMGSLRPVKGFSFLLRAFATLHKEFSNWSLLILGEGPQRDELESLAHTLEIRDRVHLPGRVDNPAPHLLQAELFVLPSLSEGFPNSLCEAMACGLPAVASDCRSGPAEIIRDGHDGLLVPPGDETALAQSLAALMRDKTQRETMGRNAAEISQRFNETTILTAWDTLIQEAAAHKR